MKTVLNAVASPENIVSLAVQPKSKPARRKQRFRIIEFRNHTGSQSWRVDGYKLDGSRVRENFADLKTAQCRQIELEAEALKQPLDNAVRATKLSEDALRVAEFAMLKLGDDWARLPDAVDFWLKSGAKSQPGESPRIDEAVDAFLKWLAASDLRDTTKKHWRNRITLFKNTVPNARVSEVTPDDVWAFMDARKITASGKSAYRSAISKFFSWCIERPRRWVNFNPCQGVTIKQTRNGHPDILSLADCEAILDAAEAHKGGILAPYVAVCLFGGFRPTEAARLDWGQVNLDDGEILLAQDQTKTKKSRVVKICPTLARWLNAHKDKPFYPTNFRKEFDAVKLAAGLKGWTPDIMRHTAISHYFRKTGSYGFTAEQFGNSEAIIKNHYQGRVSTEETKAFYAIMPTKGGGK